MFLYLKNRFNPAPDMTLMPALDAGDQRRYMECHGAPLMRLPADADALQARRRGKFWADIRRRERKFSADFAALEFRVLTDPAELDEWLPKVHALFIERWEGEHTGSAWATADGFARYSDAMKALAPDGEGSVAVLYRADDRSLIAYSYNLVQDGTLYLYQHAASVDPAYRAYAPGVIFMTTLIRQLVEDPDFHTLDFMIGLFPYKLEWADCVQRVYRIIDREQHSSSLRFQGAIVREKAQTWIRNTPWVYRVTKRAIRTLGRK